jgi:hypothetical protein
VGALVGTVLVPPREAAAPADAPSPDAPSDPLLAASVGGPSTSSREAVGPLPGTLATHAGSCGYPVTGCVDVVGQQWVDLRVAEAPGAVRVDLWVNWTPASQAATGLQATLFMCGTQTGCGQTPLILARQSGGLSVGPGSPQSIRLQAGLADKHLAGSLFLRVASSTADQPMESTPHAGLQQDFVASGFIARAG